MARTYKKSLFIFRRDLRIGDNTGLAQAALESEQVMPLFILDYRQISEENPYRGAHSIQFMLEALSELAQDIEKYGGTLFIAHATPDLTQEEILGKIIETEKIDAVFVNHDYTPFSLKRDQALHKMCTQHNIPLISFHDALLNTPDSIKTKNQTPYTVFTPFFKACSRIEVAGPISLPRTVSFVSGHGIKKNSGAKNSLIKYLDIAQLEKVLRELVFDQDLGTKKNQGSGVSTKALNSGITDHASSAHSALLAKNLKKLENYKTEHDIPKIPTSHLSAHLKFGTISVRQAHHAITKHLGAGHPLIRQLYWRDFFYHVAYHSPFVFGHAYHEKYDNLAWNSDKSLFKLWCNGKTGFPIVDAGMRELNSTGFMHNRVRMITASFLVKDLHINWLWGEKYFAQQLTDYDPCVNNGNWQWCASTGCDAQPYFRIFNPWLQQKKFDPECEYIKLWVPELKKIKPSVIHTWFKNSSPEIAGYPRPILDHARESVVAKHMHRKT
jgi:deoxyribodipyrimidine photo-lyase